MQPMYETQNKTTQYSFLRTSALCAALITGLALVGCGGKNENPPTPATQKAPPPEVGVVIVKLGRIPLSTELPGRLEAFRIAQVRARAAGILQKRLFQEGADVKASQRLFQIDNTPYQANLQSAQAGLAQAQATLAQTEATVRRYRPLVEANAISKQDFDAAVAAHKASLAQVAAARASITNANVNLGYATVTAPISGRIGRAAVTEGALVGQGEPTLLATIQQIHPLYVNVTQSSLDILRLKEAVGSGKLQGEANDAQVQVFTSDGRAYAHLGRLLFTDLTVDETTGQVSVRAELPNPDGLLLPGMYVRVRLTQAQVENAFTLPQQAVTRNEKGNFVMVVAEDGSIAPRQVQINGSQASHWIVTGGLKEGEKVMVDGLIKVGMGATKVTPVPWQPSNQTAASVSPHAAPKEDTAPQQPAATPQ